MRILIAPEAFKGTFSAIEVAEAMAKGLDGEVTLCPIADGGDGLLEVLEEKGLIDIQTCQTVDAFKQPINAPWGKWKSKNRAVIEMAKVCGLALVPKAKRNPLYTTTFGLGEMIRKLAQDGIAEILIGMGGSSTCDGGAGMANALGWRFYDEKGERLTEGGGALRNLVRIEREEDSLKGVQIQVACDVNTPLLGPKGAARFFAPQKGAKPVDVEMLQAGIVHLAEIVQRDLGIDISKIPFGGAAGGASAGAVAFLGATLCSGGDLCLKLLKFDQLAKKVDLIITGEGCLDEQTLFGKGPLSVLNHGKKHSIPVIAVVGHLGQGYEKFLENGFSGCYETEDQSLEAITQTTQKAVSLHFTR